jgi:hypothetical protein
VPQDVSWALFWIAITGLGTVKVSAHHSARQAPPPPPLQLPTPTAHLARVVAVAAIREGPPERPPSHCAIRHVVPPAAVPHLLQASLPCTHAACGGSSGGHQQLGGWPGQARPGLADQLAAVVGAHN